MNRLTIIGASGHGKVVADIARLKGYSEIAFLDDARGLSEVSGYPVLGRVSAYPDRMQDDFIVAIGDAATRRRIQEELAGEGAKLVTLMHPSAVVAKDVEMGAGSVVMAGAVVNPSVKIGRGCIVNTCASVDHDCAVGDFAHVSVGAHLAGGVAIGDGTWIGIGAVVNNCLSICPNCVVGAGAVVISDINDSGTYVGVPARLVSRK